MGLPVHALTAAANQHLDNEFFNAPLRLQAESYESFAERLHSSVQQDGVAQASVEEELRRLQIDPEVFYRNAQRLGVCEYSTDDLDPTSRSTEQVSLTPSTTLAALLASSADEATTPEAITAQASFDPPRRGVAAPNEDSIDQSRVKEIESYTIDTEADNACRLGMCGLNMPDSEAVEDEIILDDTEEMTCGGRMSCGTPQGLQAKLQIDSLTDDEDEEVLQTDAVAADGEDQIEAFTLDPDFDYDTVTNLSRRL